MSYENEDSGASPVERLGNKVGKLAEDVKGYAASTSARLLDLEQKATTRPRGTDAPDSPGARLIASPEFKALNPATMRDSGRIVVGSFGVKTALIGTGSAVVRADHRGIVMPAAGVLSVRGLFAAGRTDSNSVDYARETSAESAMLAEPQYYNGAYENVAKKEAALSFELASARVATIAHWLPASRQILSDAPQLAQFVDARLTYGVQLAEEDQVLNGTGTNGDLEGLITLATDYAGAAGDNTLDRLLRAVGEVGADTGLYAATGVVLNPRDVTGLLLLKASGSGDYLFGSLAELEAKLGVRIAVSRRITQGTYLAGDFLRGAALLDREDATVRVAEQHSDFFVKNMVAILAESRVALPVYAPAAFITGDLPAAETA